MADKDHLILTAIGPDQVGLVEKISQFISRHGCNIEDSKMAVFCGEFAVIVLISGDGGSLVKIASDYREMETETGLSFAVKRPSTRKPTEFFLPYKLTVSCMDHPGIVYQVSGVLSTLGINIESMSLPRRSGMLGSPVSTSFVPIMRVTMFGLYVTMSAGKNGETPIRPCVASML